MMSVELMQEELEMASRVLDKWKKHFDAGFLGPEDPNSPVYGGELLLNQYCDELYFAAGVLEKIAEITARSQMANEPY